MEALAFGFLGVEAGDLIRCRTESEEEKKMGEGEKELEHD